MITDHATHRQSYEYFITHATNLLYILSKEGMILEANRYAISLAGKDFIGCNFKDVIIDFIGQFDFSRVVEDSSKEHLLNVTSTSGLPQSFYFTFIPTAHHILAFGRLDTAEIHSMQKQMPALNRN